LSQPFEDDGTGDFNKCGTQGYIAPEIWSSVHYNLPFTDIFALGVVLFIMVTSSYPFKTTKGGDRYYELLNQNPIVYSKFIRK